MLGPQLSRRFLQEEALHTFRREEQVSVKAPDIRKLHQNNYMDKNKKKKGKKWHH